MNFRAYPLAWAEHAAVRAAASRWQRRGLLAPAQRAAIEAAYPLDYFRPDSIWLRLLLFGCTCLAGSTAFFTVAEILSFSPPVWLLAVLVALGSGAVLEIVITRKHYRSGVDNALLYAMLGALQFCLLEWFREPSYVLHYGALNEFGLLATTLLLYLLALWRYADPLVASAAFGTALLLLGRLLLLLPLGPALLPFAMMLAAGALVLALRQLPRRADFYYYRSVYYILRTLGLAVLYLAGNYLVVREGNAKLLGTGGPSEEIPFALVFWSLTFAVPVLYLVLGVRRHDRLLLWVGVLALGFSVYTFRTYHAVLPPAVAATLAGALLTVLALGLLRYLRTPRHGLTTEADDEVRPPVNLENFIQLETAHVADPPPRGFEFGGGSSGGGGAEGRF